MVFCEDIIFLIYTKLQFKVNKYKNTSMAKAKTIRHNDTLASAVSLMVECSKPPFIIRAICVIRSSIIPVAIVRIRYMITEIESTQCVARLAMVTIENNVYPLFLMMLFLCLELEYMRNAPIIVSKRGILILNAMRSSTNATHDSIANTSTGAEPVTDLKVLQNSLLERVSELL